MGRGRAKAKQTKVARDLKYHSPATDYRQLEKELSGRTDDDAGSGSYDDPYLSSLGDRYAGDTDSDEEDDDADQAHG